MADDDDPIWDIPGFEELHDTREQAAERLHRKASIVANYATGVWVMEHKAYERAVAEYRELAEAHQRAVEIRTQCYEAYIGDYEY